jgi:hypothetical protein
VQPLGQLLVAGHFLALRRSRSCAGSPAGCADGA